MNITKEETLSLCKKNSLTSRVREMVIDALGYGIWGDETHTEEIRGNVGVAVKALEDGEWLKMMDTDKEAVEIAHEVLHKLLI